MDYSRVMIIGCPGSGKTTFAKKFGNILGREVIHLDRLLWRSGWTMPPVEERIEIHNGLINKDSWIIDGMWNSLVADRFNRATAVIFFDYPRHTCVMRAIGRFFKYRGKHRDDLAEGCNEMIDKDLMQCIWTFNKQRRPYLYGLIEQHKEVDCVIFRKPKDAENFLNEMANRLQ